MTTSRFALNALFMALRNRYSATLNSLDPEHAPDGTVVYWIADAPRSTHVLQSQADFAHPVVSDRCELLKQSRNRFVYRHIGEAGSLVVKLFPLNFLSGFGYKAYGYTEFANARTAEVLGLKVPQTYAYIEKRRYGHATCVGLIFEDLAGHRALSRLVGRKYISFAAYQEMSSRALIDLYIAGANHLDGRDANFLADPDTGDVRTIDWQHAEFVTPRSAWLLEYLAGFYLRRNAKHRQRLVESGWIENIHAMSHHPTPLRQFEARVHTLASRRYSFRQRSKLVPVRANI